ncbi:MAG: hypothetical protein M3Q30_02355 [Actinomycetota bacterium]|nr:hypothetical protein [Actinomycetota bacterium]
MRVLRAFIIVIVALGVLLVASPASAQVSQISFGQPRLGPEGASVVIPMTVVCDVGFNLAFGDVGVSQSSGHKLASAFGFFSNNYPGVPCTGAPQAITIRAFDFSPYAFKLGSAAAFADVTVFNPVTGDLITKTTDPQVVRITR